MMLSDVACPRKTEEYDPPYRLLLLGGRRFLFPAPGDEPGDQGEDRGRGYGYDDVVALGGMRDRLSYLGPVIEHQLHGHVHQEGRAQVDQDREPVHDVAQDGRPEDDQRDRERDADRHQRHVAPRHAHQRDNVVQRHHHVGDHDDPDGVPQPRAGLDVLIVVLLLDELPGDPQQGKPPDDLEVRQAYEERNDGDEDEPQPDGPGHPDQDSPPAHRLVEAAHGERDDDRVVPGEYEVYEQDPREPAQHLRRKEICQRSPNLPRATARALVASNEPRDYTREGCRP